jgi:hypothetical protein
MPAATAATLVDAMEDPEEDSMASLHAISHARFIVTFSIWKHSPIDCRSP